MTIGNDATDTFANTFPGTFQMSHGTLILNKANGTNAIAGILAITSGTVSLGNSNQIADTATVNLSGGTLDLNNKDEIFGVLNQTGGTILSTGGTKPLNVNFSTSSFTGGTIAPSVSVTTTDPMFTINGTTFGNLVANNVTVNSGGIGGTGGIATSAAISRSTVVRFRSPLTFLVASPSTAARSPAPAPLPAIYGQRRNRVGRLQCRRQPHSRQRR